MPLWQFEEDRPGRKLRGAFDSALEKLTAIKPNYALLEELRYFAGQTGDEAAAALGVSPATADRMWRFARAWLQVEMAAE